MPRLLRRDGNQRFVDKGRRDTVGSGNVLTSFSIVAPVEAIDADTSVAVRPGVGLTWTAAPRAAIVGFAGYMINRPDVLYRNAAGQEFRDQWKVDSVVLSIGVVYSLF